MNKQGLSFTPIGGLGEMGKNQMLVEIDADSFLIDNGFKHSCKETPGVDLYIGRYKDLYKKNPSFVLITHGHLDHVGGIPILLRDIPEIKIFCTEFAKRIILNLLEQYGKNFKPNFDIIKVGDLLEFERFKIKTFKMDHSVIESLGFVCETAYGNFLHTGDFRINLNSPYEATDLKILQEYGKKGILCMFSDSTNAAREGSTESETAVINQIELILKERTQGKFIIATFSTQIERIKGIINLSKKLQKKILIDGRSMKNIFAICVEMGLFLDTEDVLINQERDKDLKDNDLIILTTGTQGEIRSGLNLVSRNRHKTINVNKKDTILMSSSFIPGNEESINNLINSFSEKEIEVITYKDFLIHVSGHGYKEELKKILNVVNPKYFVPIHGESYSMYHHKKLAIESGIKNSDIFLLKNGDKLSINKDMNVSIEKDSIDIELIYKDGNNFSPLSKEFLENRRKLEKNGVISIFLIISKKQKVIKFFDIKNVSAFLSVELYRKNILRKISEGITKLEKNLKTTVLEKNISDWVESYIFYVTKKSPIVVVSVVLEESMDSLTFSRMNNKSSSD